MTAPRRKTVLVIGGPTASGKSGLALSLAGKTGGVVINADSMQLYQGLPLLTAQPSREDRERAPHRLYEALGPDDSCDAARWRDMALAEIEKTDALPIIVGGTGFYIKTLLKGISPMPDVPQGVREKLAALQKKLGNPGFHRELAKRDPVMAAKLDPFNTQRLVRAFEVLEATGRSLAEWQSLPPTPPPAHLKFITVVLLPERETLYKNCDGRFGAMLEKGALDEVRDFSGPASSPLCKALGYPELRAHLDERLTLEEAERKARISTHRYAKRQVTWFRHQMTADLVLPVPDAERVLPLL